MTPSTVAWRVWRSRHALISFAHPSQIDVAAAICQSFALDNGAFSAWRQGEPVRDWTAYYAWVGKWHSHPGFDFALIPDVIDGNETDNDVLLAEWPHAGWGVPVWHLHESIDRFVRLAQCYPRVALGSSGQYARVGSDPWWARISVAMVAVQRNDGFPCCKLHGLRMLNPKVFTRLPLASADSTNVARNVGLDKAWRAPYRPRSKETRGIVLAERIEEHNSAAIWKELAQETADWISEALAACD